MSGPLEVSVIPSVGLVDRASWDSLVGPSPFLRHAFLSALEASDCLGERAGWLSSHLVARSGGRVVGLAPAFIKLHSMGEFVYDWAWADAAQRFGVAYYPKLILAAPFSPVTGRRLFGSAEGLAERGGPTGFGSGHDPDAIARALLMAATEYARQVECSGVHLLFCTEREVKVAAGLGFAHRLGCQFHWTHAGYRDFDDYLHRFDSKRRNQIRRERRRVREQGVEVVALRGAEVGDDLIGPAFDFYGATVDRYVWGRRYLNRRFFELLWRDCRDDLQLVVARRGGQLVGGAINLQADLATNEPGGHRRFGRYWGTTATIDSLHFEVCSYASIEDCIRTGVTVFEAGAGGDQHKLVRGFLPTATHSSHLLFEPRFHRAIDDFCQREAQHVSDQIERLGEGVFAR